MIKKIGVMGCGWLGLPLAKHFVAAQHIVHGTTTSKTKLELLKDGDIHPHQIALFVDRIQGNLEAFLSSIDYIIINIPPKLRSRNSENFLKKMELLHAEIRKNSVSHIIFVSSTAVYGNIQGEVTEETQPQPITESGRQLLESERLFSQDNSVQSTIVRFGGLIGPNRHPINILSKKEKLTNGNDPINLIHLDDCIHMISTILENDYWGEIFNGVYPLHPTKKEFYTQVSLRIGIPPPDYSKSIPSPLNKIIVGKNFTDKAHRFKKSIIL